MTNTEDLTAGYKRRPLGLARRLAGITTTAGRRAYLEETGSRYADNADPVIIDYAFFGHVEHALKSLADEYERELAGHAAATEELASARHTLAVTATALAEAQEAAEGY